MMRRSSYGLAIALLAATCLLTAGSAAAARPMAGADAAGAPRRRLAQAYASATADASNGASVFANSNAVSTNGAPTSSVVSASGSGQGTVVRCGQTAANGQQLSKDCGSSGGKSCGQGWYDAPRCSGGARETARDQQGCAWGFEGKPCAIGRS